MFSSGDPGRFRAPARPRRFAVATVATVAIGAVSALTAGLVAVLPTADADAAAFSQTPVGATAFTLTQPSDNLLGRMTPAADADTKGMFAAQARPTTSGI